MISKLLGQALKWTLPHAVVVGKAGYWLASKNVPDIRSETGYGRLDIRLSKRPDIRPNMQLGLQKERPETFLSENAKVQLFTVVGEQNPRL